jgi:hypothetical protein
MTTVCSSPSPRRAAGAIGDLRRLTVLCGTVSAALVALACREVPLEPQGPALAICHMTEVGGAIAEIPARALGGHKAHGDYVTRLIVDPASLDVGDSIHFSRITDALAVARAGRMARQETAVAACRITIAVTSGTFQGSIKESDDPTFERLPLVIDVPDLTLLGAFSMTVDAKARALGTLAPADPIAANNVVTTLAASPGLITIRTTNPPDKYGEPIIVVNAHPDGPRGDGAIIEGFVFQSGNTGADAVVGGNAIVSMRASGLVFRGNQIEGGFGEPVELRASAASIERNFMTGRAGSCGFCLFGPGAYQVSGNRLMGPGGIPGILFFPTMSAAVFPVVEPFVLPASALVTGTVTNNAVHNHQAIPVGVGLRIAAIGVGAPNVVGTSRVVARDNDLSGNRFGITLEAGFAVANTVQRGDIEITMSGNTMAGSCQNAMLVSLPTQQTGLGLANASSVRNSTYTVSLGSDIAWSDVWYSHPAGLGNTLIVNGEALPNGSRTAYDATKVCTTP